MSTSTGSADTGFVANSFLVHTLATFILLIFGSNCLAIITVGGSGRNTSAPTGALADSGWQYEGFAGSFTGTAVGPNSFITAQHIGSLLGGSFQFDGQSYPITGETADPNSDLVVYTVDGTLPTYAPLFPSGQAEAGQAIVMYGRGDDRGAPVVVGGQTKGWQWGAGDGSLSWGTDTIAASYGAMYGWQFSNNDDPDEGQVASGDSGGGIFIDNNGVWELDGVINSVQAVFSVDGSTPINAAIYDENGLYEQMGTSWYKVPASTAAQSSWGYATSVSTHATFVQAALGTTVPEPTSALVCCGGLLLLRRSRRLIV